MIYSIFADGGNAMLLPFRAASGATRSHAARSRVRGGRINRRFSVVPGLSLNAVPIVTIDLPGRYRSCLNDLDDSLSMQRLRLASGPLIAAALAVLPPWIIATSAQTPPRPPGQVPFLNFPNTGSPPPGTTPPAPSRRRRRQRLAQARRASAARQGTADHPQRAEEGARDREPICAARSIRSATTAASSTASSSTSPRACAASSSRSPPPSSACRRSTRRSGRCARRSTRRRHLIGNVLAALQRIGRNPPPAMLVTPEDALQSVRSAILFGAVLPEMRQDVETLATDLSALASVRKEIAAERASLEKSRATLADDIAQLTALTEHRQKQQAEVEKALTAERERAAQLGRQVRGPAGADRQARAGTRPHDARGARWRPAAARKKRRRMPGPTWPPSRTRAGWPRRFPSPGPRELYRCR